MGPPWGGIECPGQGTAGMTWPNAGVEAAVLSRLPLPPTPGRSSPCSAPEVLVRVVACLHAPPGPSTAQHGRQGGTSGVPGSRRAGPGAWWFPRASIPAASRGARSLVLDTGPRHLLGPGFSIRLRRSAGHGGGSPSTEEASAPGEVSYGFLCAAAARRRSRSPVSPLGASLDASTPEPFSWFPMASRLLRGSYRRR